MIVYTLLYVKIVGQSWRGRVYINKTLAILPLLVYRRSMGHIIFALCICLFVCMSTWFSSQLCIGQNRNILMKWKVKVRIFSLHFTNTSKLVFYWKIWIKHCFFIRQSIDKLTMCLSMCPYIHLLAFTCVGHIFYIMRPRTIKYDHLMHLEGNVCYDPKIGHCGLLDFLSLCSDYILHSVKPNWTELGQLMHLEGGCVVTQNWVVLALF